MWPEKISPIYTKYTYSYYGIYLYFCVGYTISVSFIEFLRKFWVCDKNAMLGKRVITFERLKFYVRCDCGFEYFIMHNNCVIARLLK